VDFSPGRFHRNLRASSFDTWHAAGARSPIAAISNFRNTYVNYYHKGAVVALLLDLEIRQRTDGRRSLDDVIRQLYRTNYAEAEINGYFLRGAGYTEQDIYDAVEKVAGKDVRDFLERLVAGAGELDYKGHLEYVGLELTRAPKKNSKKGENGEADRAQLYSGLVVPDARERAGAEFVSVVNALPGSPAEQAGISIGDMIVAIDGERVDGRRWESVLAMKHPGDRLQVALFRGSRLLTIDLRTEERDTRPYRIESLEGASAAQRRARSKWLGKVGESQKSKVEIKN
jgi:predicted metalloprotease with PDZ domain